MTGTVKLRCDCCGVIYRVGTQDEIIPCPKCGGGRIYIMGHHYVVLDVSKPDNPVTAIVEDSDE